MIYNEVHIATARTVAELISILSTKVPDTATADVASGDYQADVEVWYDKDTNTVILK